MTRLEKLLSIALICFVGSMQASAPAAEAPSADSQAAAKKIVAEWFAALANAKSLGVEIETKVELAQDGEVVKSDDTAYRVAVQRPNQFALVTTKGMNLSFVADAKKVYEYVEPLNKYTLSESPLASLAALSDSKVLKFVNFRLGLGVFGDALRADSFDAFWNQYKSPEYVGVEEKNGAKAHHVRLTRETMPFDVWFAADGAKLLVIQPDLKAGLAAEQNSLPPGVTYVIATTYKNWSLDAAPAADAFAIAPPPSAELVDDLFAEPPHKLLGRQAPVFETTTHEGKPVKLADLTGKVVMLDFWATWCGPCIAALPKVNEVATKYKDKGVVFYAVNQQEEASIIKEFLAAQKWELPVALDLAGEVGKLYAVEGIPQTVIIDKQGKIQVVHVGAGPDIGEQLVKDLDAVLAGKDLADEKLKKKK
jgi:thiol-disulfide isomerase/thioredoxin